MTPSGTLAVDDDIDEQPWHDTARSNLWNHEQEIRERWERWYTAGQIIRLLKLTVRGRPVSETWLRDWISRRGWRRRAVEKDTAAGHPQPSTASAPAASPARPDENQHLAPRRGSAQGPLLPTARELREAKAKQYVRDDALSPVVRKAIEESKK